VLKHERMRITTAGEEAFRATALRPKRHFFMTKAHRSDRVWTLLLNTIVGHCVLKKISSFRLELWEKHLAYPYRQMKIPNNRYFCRSMATRGSLKA